MAKPVLIGEYQFKTKSAARDEVRRRISAYNFGDSVSDDDQYFFEKLFELHSEHSTKVGCGIESIQVERDFNNNKCLFITRIDGSKVDISWVHCLQPASKKNVISMAFRRAIKERIVAFKSKVLEVPTLCPVYGVALNFENSHVVYVDKSFESLLSDFISIVGTDFESIEIVDPKSTDKDHRGMLKDSEILSSWRAFHTDKAQLQLISAKANLRRKF